MVVVDASFLIFEIVASKLTCGRSDEGSSSFMADSLVFVIGAISMIFAFLAIEVVMV